MVVPSQELVQLETIQAQLASDDPVLHTTSKFTVTHLTFNSFLKSDWSLASIFPHVQIGVRNGQPVYAFSTRDAFCTVAAGKIPDLASINNSHETLEDVQLVAPLDFVDEWKSEMSGGGNLSREFRAFLKYLFLLHVSEGGPAKHLGLPVDIEDLKVALMMVHQGRHRKAIVAPPPGSVDGSDAASVSVPQPVSTPHLSELHTLTRDAPATAAHFVDQPAASDDDPSISVHVQTYDQNFDPSSSNHAPHEHSSGILSRQHSLTSISKLPSTNTCSPLPIPSPTPASDLVPVLAHESSYIELENVDNAPNSFISRGKCHELISERDDQTRGSIHGPALHTPVKGVFSISGPGHTRSNHKQVSVADDVSETDTGLFIASYRKDFRNKSKPPDDRRTGNASKAVGLAEEQTESQPGTSASDEGTTGYDDETDIEIVDASEPNENTYQSYPIAPSEQCSETEAHREANMDAKLNSRTQRKSYLRPLQDAHGGSIERVAFQAAAQPPTRQQKADNTGRQSATGVRNEYRKGLGGNVRSRVVAPVIEHDSNTAARWKQYQSTHVGIIPLEAMPTEYLQLVAEGKTNTLERPGRVPLAQRILAERTARSQVVLGPVMLRSRNVREYPDDVLAHYTSGEVQDDGNWNEDMRTAVDELKRRAALRYVEGELEPNIPAQDQQLTSRMLHTQLPRHSPSQLSQRSLAQDRVQAFSHATMQPQTQEPIEQPAQASHQLPVQTPQNRPIRLPSQDTVSSDVESIAALRQILGDEALLSLLRYQQATVRMQRDWPMFVIPIGVVVGVLHQNAQVAVAFHVMLPQHPAAPVAKTWYAFSVDSGTPVSWNPPDRSHESLIAEIDLFPMFQLRGEEDFLALLCLVVIMESQRWFGDPYSHRIPIARYCRGRLIEMSRDITEARITRRSEIRLQESGALQGNEEAKSDQTSDAQPRQQAETVQALFDVSRKIQVRPTQHPDGHNAAAHTTAPIEVESFAALKHAIGEESLEMLPATWGFVLGYQPSDQAFCPIGIQVGSLASNSQYPQKVVAFIAPGSCTQYSAPVLFTLNNEADVHPLEIAQGEAVGAIMPAVQWLPEFREVDMLEDLLALVSLAILMLEADGLLGVVEPRIPIMPWCRGHLAMLAKRIAMNKQEASRLRSLKRMQEQMAQETGTHYKGQSQHRAKRTRVESPQVQSRDLAPATAARAPHQSFGDVTSRNPQVAHANRRQAQQIYIWHTQNVAARKIMADLVREGKAETQQYHDLDAVISAREQQIQGWFVSVVFPNSETGHQLNVQFPTLMNPE